MCNRSLLFCVSAWQVFVACSTGYYVHVCSWKLWGISLNTVLTPSDLLFDPVGGFDFNIQHSTIKTDFILLQFSTVACCARTQTHTPTVKVWFHRIYRDRGCTHSMFTWADERSQMSVGTEMCHQRTGFGAGKRDLKETVDLSGWQFINLKKRKSI